MKLRILTTSLSLVLLSTMGCKNLFNPNGNVNSNELDAPGLIQYGDQLLREKRNTEAFSVFEKAINLDSSLSYGYYGKAKASLRQNNVNPTVLVDLVLKMQEEDADPVSAVGEFVADLDSSVILGIEQMNEILTPLIRRDTINDAFKIYQKYNSSSSSNFATEVEEAQFDYFKSTYVDEGNSNYALTDFPIMDGVITNERIFPEYQIGTAIKTFHSISELLGDSEEIGTLLSDLASGEANLTDLAVFEETLNDTAKQANFNNLIDEINSGVSILDLAPDMLEGQEEGDSTQSDSDIQEQIDQVGGAIIFYKIADGQDNDGDGCVDEEIYDGVDNDLDGVIDEDLRGNPVDFVDNDLDGSIDNSIELVNPVDTILLFVQSPSYTMGADYANEEIKLAIAQDTDQSVYSISDRRTRIGGCW